MNDHIPDLTKMIGETPRTDERSIDMYDDTYSGSPRYMVATSFARQLERELNAANSKIELLMSANADVARIADERDAAEKRIPLLIAERDTAQLRASQNWKIREEFRALLGTDDVSTALAVVRELKQRIKRMEEMYEGEIGENEQFLGSNLQGLLIRELNWSKERIKRLEEAGDKLEYASVISEAGEDPNGFEKLLIAQREWCKAKEAKP